MRFQKFIVIAPTFNNAGTLPGVLDALQSLGVPVLVVDDGSTDATASILAFRERIEVVTHAINRGKAFALCTGFARASELGYTHAVTIDTDGQHDPRNVPELIDLSKRHPDAMILGTRDFSIAGYPLANRMGRRISNALIRLHSGVRVNDSQCGLRVYPLVARQLRARAERFGYETEILVHCGWAQVRVIESPVHCCYEVESGRVSHFKPWRDSLSAVAMHARLLAASCFTIQPARIGVLNEASHTGTIIERLARWFSPMRAWRAVRHDRKEHRRFAFALALGVLIANLPIYGVQSLTSLLLAKRLRLHPLAVLTGSHLSTPPVGPLLIAMAIATGHFLLHGDVLSLADLDPARMGYQELMRRVAADWIVGSIVCGIGMAIVAFVVAQFTLRLVTVVPTQLAEDVAPRDNLGTV